jgi:hypothetical protein
MDDTEFDAMSAEELVTNLVTCDYRGQAFKRKCLDELLNREHPSMVPVVQGLGIIYRALGNILVIETNFNQAERHVGCAVTIDVFKMPSKASDPGGI